MVDKTALVVDNKDDEINFKIGMTFSCEDEAYNTYNMYAIYKGFGVRRGQKSYNRKNELRRCIFLCSCEGFSPFVPPHEQRKIERIDTRCGCKARVRFGIEGDVWTVIDLIAEHNHELIKEDQRHLIKSGKKITETSSSVLQSMATAGIRATKAYSYITNEAGGAKNVGFTLRDCQNFLQSQRMKMISAGDAQSLINHFKLMQTNDSMFFYTTQIDDQSRLSNFFWRDGLSKIDYDCFGDVVIFDATYRIKEGIVNEYDFGGLEGDLASSRTIRLNNLMRKAFSVMSISAAHVDTTKIANEILDVLIDRLKSHRENIDLGNEDMHIRDLSSYQGTPSLLDPPKVRAKGIGYGRQKGPLEKRRKRVTKNAPSTSQPGYAYSNSQPGFTHFANDYGQNMTYTSLLSQISSYNCPEFGARSMRTDMEL